METSSSNDVSTRLHRVATLAREAPNMVLTTLAHNIDMSFMREAYRYTNKGGAVGIDGQTASEFDSCMDDNLRELLGQFKSGKYRAPAVKRVYIPKAGGEQLRPIGIPTLKVKVLQRAVSLILEAIYEQDFFDRSYGFRRGRSAHMALDTLWHDVMSMGGASIIELDIRDFFGTLDHKHLRAFLDRRVRDGVIRKAIDKWLCAGVMEEGSISRSESGTPQGGVISPILANIFLHEVLDTWFFEVVKPRLRGKATLVRFADDAVCIFESREDARKVLEVLPKRFAKYGLSLHPEKTRLVNFYKPAGKTNVESFDFLGFTHYWGKSRQGKWIVYRKTARDRLRRSIRSLKDWCRQNRHMSLRDQHKQIALKLSGHYGYFGITGNMRSLSLLHHETKKVWHKWLSRRSEKAAIPWDRFLKILRVYPLPKPRIVHSAWAASPTT